MKRFALLFLFLFWSSILFGTDVFYSVRPAGAGDGNDLKVACNITITAGGVAEFSEIQTGDIGVGCYVSSDNTSGYISEMTDSTHAKIITAVGAAHANVSVEALGAIYHPYASLSAAEAGSDDANHLTDDDIATGEYNLYWYFYGATVDGTKLTVADTWLTSANYHITVYVPRGVDEKESINNWRHQGVWSDNYAHMSASLSGTSLIAIPADYICIDGIQINCENATQKGISVTGDYSTIKNNIIKNTIYFGSGSGISISYTSNHTIYNNIIYHGNTGINIPGGFTSGNQILNCTISDMSVSGVTAAADQYGGGIAVKNCAVFDTADDWAGTLSCDYCASDDADATTYTNGIDWDNGATDWAAAMPDYATGDFSIDATSSLYHQGTDVDLDYDIVGTPWHATTPSIGAFEYVASGSQSVVPVIAQQMRRRH